MNIQHQLKAYNMQLKNKNRNSSIKELCTLSKTALSSFSHFVFYTIIIVQSGCKKFVDIESPVTALPSATVYNSDATAISAVTGLYTAMAVTNNFATGASSISFFCGLSADEFTLYSGASSATYLSYYRNALSINSGGYELWINMYRYVYSSNSVIEGLNKSTALTPAVKQQLMGEAKFMRAFLYFYLVNLYGDLPLVLSTDYRVNATLSRTSAAQVYQQIISDLKDAQDLLSENYLKSDAITAYLATAAERVRPTKWSASALLARAYLYTNKNDSAEIQATAVINQPIYSLPALNSVFLKNSNEAIWQLPPVNSGFNTEDGKLFILPATGPSSSVNPVYLSNTLLSSFETGDQRKSNWVASVTPTPPGTTSYFYPNKYKANVIATTAQASEYLMILRLGEQYLIRAEARARQNNLSGAITDLDKIRLRANLPLIANTNPSISQIALLDVILHERQMELFSEWGHRWLDLKRTGKIDAVMSLATPSKGGGTWNSYQQLYPIYSGDIQKDPNLNQNLGY